MVFRSWHGLSVTGKMHGLICILVVIYGKHIELKIRDIIDGNLSGHLVG